MPRETSERMDAAIESLSPRRRELLELLAKGFRNDEIAAALTIAPGTVRVHVTAILEHLDLTNRTEAAAAFVAFEARPAQVSRVLDRPAIAVLPLAVLDSNPRSRSMAAGLTEDLASLFARWCWFPVIATSSSATSRARGESPEVAAQALGARFIVDGSVRSHRNGMRVSLRVDDVTTRVVIWAEQRDVRFDAWHEEPDELCQAVVAAAYPVMVTHAAPRATGPCGPTTLAAWELAHEGMALRALRDADANASAFRHFDEAIARDPTLVLAHFGRGLCAYDAVLNQWDREAPALGTLQRAAAACVELAPHGAEGYFLEGRYLQSVGDWAQAISPLEAAIGRNPSFALAHATLAQSLLAIDDVPASLVRMRHAVRLGPRSFQAGLASLEFMQSRYAPALASAEGALVATPRYAFARALAAASAWWLGDTARGAEHLRLLRHSNPQFEPKSFAKTFSKDVASVDRFTRALEALADAH